MPEQEKIIKYMTKIVGPSIIQTLRMVSITLLLGFTLGFIVACLLTLYRDDGLKPNKKIYASLSFIVSTIRSFPGLILIVAISPFTRFIMGTTVGAYAAVVPLTISCMAFVAKLLEDAFKTVDKQLIEAAKSFGASNGQIIFKVIIKESIPAMISVATMATISYIAMSTIAGTVGGGGLGAVALNYGYQSFNDFILYTCVIILFIMVQFVQWLGNRIYKKFL